MEETRGIIASPADLKAHPKVLDAMASIMRKKAEIWII